MCQLLSMNCNTPNDIILSFTGFSARGGGTDEHKDGWGIAFFEEQGVRHFIDDKPAVESALAELVKSQPIKAKNVIAHIRKATQGEISLKNCHPFIRQAFGQEWVFAHNGDLKNFKPNLNGAYQALGNTDSELAFCYLMQCMTQQFSAAPGIPELRAFLKELSAELAAYGTFNFSLSNGEALYVHCSTQLYYLEKNSPDAHHKDQVALIVTEPLSKNEAWIALTAGELKVFVDGRALPEPH